MEANQNLGTIMNEEILIQCLFRKHRVTDSIQSGIYSLRDIRDKCATILNEPETSSKIAKLILEDVELCLPELQKGLKVAYVERELLKEKIEELIEHHKIRLKELADWEQS